MDKEKTIEIPLSGWGNIKVWILSCERCNGIKQCQREDEKEPISKNLVSEYTKQAVCNCLNCKSCNKILSEEEATTYMKLNKSNMFEDYASVLCPDCLKKRKKK